MIVTWNWMLACETSADLELLFSTFGAVIAKAHALTLIHAHACALAHTLALALYVKLVSFQT
jgi:hypothetical protein